MKKISYKEMAKLFRDYENKTTDNSHLRGYIVFTKNSFKEPFSLKARTYSVSSDNKAYQPNMGGYSIYGSAIDGSDPMVRLENYMADERGGREGWKVDYCYLDEGFCVKCREDRPYVTFNSLQKITVRDVTFEYQELNARCLECGEPMYTSEINDINVARRERAFLMAKRELEAEKGANE